MNISSKSLGRAFAGLWMVYIIACVLYRLLFYRNSTLDNLQFIGIFMVVLSGILVLITKRRIYEYRVNFLDVGMLFAFVFLLFRGLLTLPILSILTWASLLLFYFVIRCIGRAVDGWLFIVLTMLTLVILLSLGYAQYGKLFPSGSPYFEVTGPYSNPALYSGYLSLLFCFLFVAIDTKLFVVKSWVYWLVCILFSLLFIQLDSRASGVALAVGILYYLFFYKLKWWSIARFYKVAGVLGIMCLLVSIASVKYHERPDSVQGRFLIWKVAFTMVKEKPFLGWGVDGMRRHYMNAQADYLKARGSDKEKTLAGNNYLTYNEPLRIAVEYGLVGAAVYFLLVYLVIFKFTPRNEFEIAFKGVLLTYITLGCFSYPTFNYPALFWLALVTALFGNQRSGNWTLKLIPIIPIRYVRLGGGILVVAGLLVTCWQWNVYNRFSKILSVPINNKVGRKVDLIALGQLKLGLSAEEKFWAVYAHQLYLDGQYINCFQALKKWEDCHPVNELFILWGDCLRELKAYDEAVEKYKYAHDLVPSRQRARVHLALLYKKIGARANGDRIARGVLNEQVKVYGFETYELHQELKEAFNIKPN